MTMNWKTKITKITKTKYPLIMGAFSRWGLVDFAASFSNAGGLGIITALNIDIDEFRNELQRMKDLTDKPFGINISVFKNSMMREEDYLRYVEIGLDEGVKIFTTSAYQAPFIGRRVHEEGAFWFQKCPLIRHTVSAEKAGADAVTLIGMESAGNKNPYQHTTLVNLTVTNKLINIPIIAAGGIGDARGFLGALAMGAEAVCFGTAILCTEESPLSLDLKEQWLKTDIMTEDYFKRQYRFLRGGGVPSTAISYLEGKIVSMKDFIEKIMVDAEKILKSWGFSKNEFNTEASVS